MVVCTVRTAPLRIRRRSAFRPMLSAPKCLAILRNRTRRCSVHGQDDVAGQNARLRCGAILDDRHHHQAARLVGGLAQRIGHRNGLQGNAEPAARDAAVLEQLRHHALDGCGRNDKDLAARPEGRHAKRVARGVEHRAALLAAGKPDIEHDVPVDAAAAAGMPFGTGEIDEPEPRAGAAGSVGADGQRNGAGARLACNNRRRGDRRVRPQDRDVGGGIAAGELRRNHRAAGRDQLKLLLARQRLLGGNDNAARPQHAREMPLMRQADRDDRVLAGFRAGGQRVRELRQKVWLIGHRQLLSVQDRNETGLCIPSRLSAGRPGWDRPFNRASNTPPAHQMTKNPWVPSRLSCSTRPYSHSR